MQFTTAFLVATSALVSAQNSPPSLVDALKGTPELSELNTLIGNYPALVETLSSAGNITIFAPNNAAIRALTSNEAAAPLLATPGYVEAVLQYHVLNTSVPSSAITATPAFLPTLLANETYANVTGGQRIGAKLDDDEALILSGLGGTAKVVQADVAISNGVVHIIDTVLSIPKSASATAIQANLTALAGALTTTNLVSTVDGLKDITVFAPSNAAFADIASAVGNLTTQQAAGILQYHVVNGTVAYSSLLSNGASVKTLTGGSVNITIADGEVFVNQARVIVADVLIAGGVVHVLDAVLNPTSDIKADPENDNPVPAFAGAVRGNVPFTSGIPTATTAYVTPTDAVADGYTAAPTGALSSAAASSAQSFAGSAPRVTGAAGVAALFGGAAILAGF